jgi:hypothetical protein
MIVLDYFIAFMLAAGLLAAVLWLVKVAFWVLS